MFWILYSFFWAISQRLNFICRRFGTLCLFQIHRRCKLTLSMKMELRECPETSACKIQTSGNHPKLRMQQFWNISWELSQMAVTGKINISFNQNVLTDRCQYCLKRWIMLRFQRILEGTHFWRNYLSMIIVSWDVNIERRLWKPINQVSEFIARLEIRLVKRCKSVYLSVNSPNC